MSASASGAGSGGDARSRDHSQGNQGRTYTVEQKAAVIRIRKCSPTAFYEILGLESVKTSCTDSDIKKAYRKQSLLTHPDKNGHEHADEAFKMVSRAFGILGDKAKREKFDTHGTDPDSRFANAQAQNPFSGFASRAGGPMGGGMGRNMFTEDDISPEEMFARFFGGGGPFGGGPFGGFDTGPQFVFNLGGGPGVRVHQFGGGRPRRRPREAPGGQPQEAATSFQTLMSLLPVLLFFIAPMITSLFSSSGDSTSNTPKMAYDNPQAPYTAERTTPNIQVKYYVNPSDIAQFSQSKLYQLDRTAELNLIRWLRNECEIEHSHRDQLVNDAQGWFFEDPDKMNKARAYPMKSCERMKELGIGRR